MIKILVTIIFLAISRLSFAGPVLLEWKIVKDQQCYGTEIPKVECVVFEATVSEAPCNTDRECWLFFGEVADNAEVYLDGSKVATFKESASQHSYLRARSIYIPIALPIQKNSKITIFLSDLNQTIFKPPVGSFVGFYGSVSRSGLTDLFFRTMGSLFSAYSLLLLGFFLIFAYGFTRDPFLIQLFFYCLSAVLYLISFSELPREFFDPVLLSGPIHFSLRLLQDLILVVLVSSLFKSYGSSTRYIFIIYILFGLSISALWVAWICNPGLYRPVLLVMLVAAPLVAFPMFFAVLKIRYLEAGPFNSFVRFAFLVLAIAQVNDLFVFWQIYEGYFLVKWYIPFVVSILFFLRLQQFLKIGSQNQRTASLSYIFSRTVHDLKAPIFSLKTVIQSGSLSGEIDTVRLANDSLERITVAVKNNLDRLIKVSEERSISLLEFKGLLDGKIESVSFYGGREITVTAVGLRPRDGAKRVAGDALDWGSVIENLLGNSLEAGATVIRCKIFIKGYFFKKFLMHISDDGPGIPLERLDLLGDSIVQSGKIIGSGMGLFLTKKIILSLGGKITISSSISPPTYTKILISFPVSE